MAEIDLINAYDDCLNRLLRGETIDTCVAAYPTHATRLRLLLETTELVKRARVDSREVLYVQERMRGRVADAVRTKIRPRDSEAQRLNRIAALLVIIMLICLIAGVFLLQIPTSKPLPATQQPITATVTISPESTSTIEVETPAPQTESATPSSTATTTSRPTRSHTPTPSPSLTKTSTISLTPTIRQTATPLTCQVTPSGSFNVRIRSGGSTAFPAIGELVEGGFGVVAGFNAANGGWFAVEMDDQRTGWVASSVVETIGNCSALQPLTYPPIPTSISPTLDSGGNTDNNNNSGNSNDNDDDDDNDNEDDSNDNNDNNDND